MFPQHAKNLAHTLKGIWPKVDSIDGENPVECAVGKWELRNAAGKNTHAVLRQFLFWNFLAAL